MLVWHTRDKARIEKRSFQSEPFREVGDSDVVMKEAYGVADSPAPSQNGLPSGEQSRQLVLSDVDTRQSKESLGNSHRDASKYTHSTLNSEISEQGPLLLRDPPSSMNSRQAALGDDEADDSADSEEWPSGPHETTRRLSSPPMPSDPPQFEKAPSGRLYKSWHSKSFSFDFHESELIYIRVRGTWIHARRSITRRVRQVRRASSSLGLSNQVLLGTLFCTKRPRQSFQCMYYLHLPLTEADILCPLNRMLIEDNVFMTAWTAH